MDAAADQKSKELDAQIRAERIEYITNATKSAAVRDFMQFGDDAAGKVRLDAFKQSLQTLPDPALDRFQKLFQELTTETPEQKAARQPSAQAVEALKQVDTAVVTGVVPESAVSAPVAKPFDDGIRSPLMADVSAIDVQQKTGLLKQIEQKLREPGMIDALNEKASKVMASSPGLSEKTGIPAVAEMTEDKIPQAMKSLESGNVSQLEAVSQMLDGIKQEMVLKQQAPIASVENTAPAQSAVTPSANEAPVVAEKTPALETPKLIEVWDAVALPPILENKVAPQQAPEASVTPVAPAESVVDAKPAEVVSNVYEGVIARDGAEPVPAVAVANPSELVIGDVPAAGVTLISEVSPAATPPSGDAVISPTVAQGVSDALESAQESQGLEVTEEYDAGTRAALDQSVETLDVQESAHAAGDLFKVGNDAPLQMSPVQPKLAVFDTSTPAANDEGVCVAGPEAANDEIYEFSQKEAVGEIQTFLIARGHEEVANAVGTPTTVFGHFTAKALNEELKIFQQSQGLEATGKYDGETRAALNTHIQKLEESDSSLAGTYALLRDGLNAMQDNTPEGQPGKQYNALDIVYNKGSIEPPAPVKTEPCAPVTIVDTSKYSFPKAS